MGLATREYISIGPATTLVQNTVYSLPARAVYAHSTVVLEISPNESAWDTLTGSDTVGALAASGFIRSTTANAVVTLKAV